MKRKLFVISVDSLFFDDVQWLTDCPNLYGIYRRGSVIQKMLSTYPAMTYVAHSTMMTGCHEEMHGIYHNEKVEVGVSILHGIGTDGNWEHRRFLMRQKKAVTPYLS